MPANYERVLTSRILATEWSLRGGPPADQGWRDELPSLPPLSVLAAEIFPPWVLERRVRFLASVGHPTGTEPVLDGLEPFAIARPTALDYAAWVRGAPSVHTTDPFLAALARSFGVACTGSPPEEPDARARLDTFLGRLSGPRKDRSISDIPPLFGRLEAATIAGDRFFGRRGPGRQWTWAFGLVSRAGRIKRRVRP